MSTTTLNVPVTVLAGVGVRREIRSLFDMLDYLNEWPAHRRGPVFLTAYRACTGALAGQLTTDQARRAFVAFARLSNSLLGDAAPSADAITVSGAAARPASSTFSAAAKGSPSQA